MNILYMTKAYDVKQFLRKFIKKRKLIRGGRARGLSSVFCYNCLKFSQIINPAPGSAQIIPTLPRSVKTCIKLN